MTQDFAATKPVLSRRDFLMRTTAAAGLSLAAGVADRAAVTLL